MKFFNRFAILFIALIAVISLIFASHSHAQGSSDDSGDDIEGIEISSSQFQELYYWDVRKNEDNENENVIIGNGGLYDEEVLFRKSEKDQGGDFFTYIPFLDPDDHVLEITGWLPIRTLELEFDADEPESCALDTQIPLEAESGFEADFTLNISRYGGDSYIDLIGDGRDSGNDNFKFSWYAAISDDGAHWASVPFDLVSSTTTDTIRNSLKEYVEENGHDPGGTVDMFNWKFTPHKCEFSFKDSFNTALPNYNSRSLDHSVISGKILGKEGMKFEEWVRRTNNQREYLAIEESARKETQAQCSNIDERNLCQTALSKDFHKCYMRSIGYVPGSQYYTFEDIPYQLNNRELEFEWFRYRDLEYEPWMHSIRQNTDAFVSCFGYGAAAGDSIDVSLDSFENPIAFESSDEAREFAIRIVTGASWPISINPIFEESTGEIEPGQLKTSCSLGKMGWILCPVMNFMANVADSLFSFLEGWLQVPPLQGTSDNAAFLAWTYLRDIGNILFTVLFLGLILVQVLGGTLSGYSVRKRAPHIAVTALLINLSFIITSVAIDLSNILGSSILDLLQSFVPPTVDTDDYKTWEKIVESVAFGTQAVAGVAATLAALAALVPMLITTVFSMIIVLILLLLRQAIVIVLVVISPLAFATRLLPGTEQWFKRWKDLFTQMLMLYPAIALIFGGSYFASQIIMSSGAASGGFSGVLLAIFGLALQVIPLFITPIVMKLGGSALNSFGGKMRGAMAGAEKASIGFANSQKENISNRLGTLSAQGKIPGVGRIYRRRMRKKTERQGRKREIERAKIAGTADTTAGRATAKLFGGGFNEDNRGKIEAALAAEAEKLTQEDVKAADLRLRYDKDLQDPSKTADDINAALVSAIQSDNLSVGEQIAHLKKVVESQDIEKIDELVDISASLPPEAQRALAQAIEKNGIGNGAAHYGHPEAIRAIEEGTTVKDLHKKALDRGDYGTQDIVARQGGQALDSMNKHAADFMDAKDIAKFKRVYQEAASKEVYSKYMDEANKQKAANMGANR